MARQDGAGVAGLRDGWVRFRCSCGRSVATPLGTAADQTRRCTRCRDRARRRAAR